jgi:UPF0042 nucleotide-binding protein
VVVTGLSGAGKTTALRALEDVGYFCVDNLPLELLPSLVQLYHRRGRRLSRIAVGVDVRAGFSSADLARSLERFKKDDPGARILFLEADNATLFRRFSETRRRHPLSASVPDGIRRERSILKAVKVLADDVIDTSRLPPGEVKDVISRALGLHHSQKMSVRIMSFGYKYGLPLDADIVWDVRFLPNPNWVPELRAFDGRRRAVARYVADSPLFAPFIAQAKDMLTLLLDAFTREGKSYLTVAVGCTGGRHRSVAVAEVLSKFVAARRTEETRVVHRELSPGAE